MSYFDTAFDIVVGLEGGYVVDFGGPTRYGITEKVARANGYQGDMQALPLTIAKAIYLNDYWGPAGCGSLSWPLAALVFDCAVNQGVGTSTILLQKALGVAQDGVLGKQTTGALAKADPAELAAMFMALRALRYTGTRGFDVYGKGWLKRLFKITAAVI